MPFGERFGRFFGFSPEQKPEVKEIKEAVHEELETRFPDIDRQSFINSLEQAGAKLVRKERFIVDDRFELPKRSGSGFEYDLDASCVNPENNLKLNKTLRLMGFEVENPTITSFFQLKYIGIPAEEKRSDYTVRLRNDGGKKILTVKGKMKVVEDVKDRPEEEVELVNPQVIRDFLQAKGFKLTSHREKKRTTYELEVVLPDGKTEKVTFEIDVSPNKKLKPWAEAESTSTEAIHEAVKRINYTGESLAISESAYMKSKGLSADEIKDIRF